MMLEVAHDHKKEAMNPKQVSRHWTVSILVYTTCYSCWSILNLTICPSFVSADLISYPNFFKKKKKDSLRKKGSISSQFWATDHLCMEVMAGRNWSSWWHLLSGAEGKWLHASVFWSRCPSSGPQSREWCHSLLDWFFRSRDFQIALPAGEPSLHHSPWNALYRCPT